MLKNVAFLLLLSGSLAACDNNVNQEDTTGIETTNNPSSDKTLAAVAKDPICGMEKGASWTEYTLNSGGDTVWFCSPTCKDAYTAKNK